MEISDLTPLYLTVKLIVEGQKLSNTTVLLLRLSTKKKKIALHIHVRELFMI